MSFSRFSGIKNDLQWTRPRASKFDPRAFPGCTLWLDASDPSTLWQDTGRTTPAVATGQNISRWDDKSGEGCIVQAAAHQPTLALDQFGSRSGIKFAQASTQNLGLTGNGLKLIGSSAGGVLGFTLFLVAAPNVQPSTVGGLFYTTASNGAVRLQANIGTGSPGAFSAFGRRWDTDAGQNANAPAIAPASGATHILRVRADYAADTLELWVDGQPGPINSSFEIAQTGESGEPTSATTASTCTLGSQGAAYYFDGYLGQVIAYNRALLGDELAAIEAALASEFGMQLL